MYPLKDFSLDELEQWCTQRGYPPYRARQLWYWLYRAEVRDAAAMTNLPLNMRQQLAAEAKLDSVWMDELFRDEEGNCKAVLRLADGVRIEAAVLSYRFGLTACLSTQAGCRMACVFCASGKSWERNLSSGEIVDQVLRLAEVLERPMARLVLMGVGEPLDNYEQVLKALRQLHEATGTNLGYRHMTISTCGLVPEIYGLAREGIPVNLAISLHAVDDSIRQLLLPVAGRRHGVAQVFEAAEHYTRASGRQVTFEYALVQGVNDDEVAARQLARRVKAMNGHVNLLSLNPVLGCSVRPSPPEAVRRFLQYLQELGVSATIRRSLGVSIDAACGQLRRT